MVDEIKDILKASNYLFVLHGKKNLLVLDIKDPENPKRIVDAAISDKELEGLRSVKDKVFAVDSDGGVIEIVPDNSTIYTYELGIQARRLAMWNDYLFGSYLDHDLYVYKTEPADGHISIKEKLGKCSIKNLGIHTVNDYLTAATSEDTRIYNIQDIIDCASQRSEISPALSFGGFSSDTLGIISDTTTDDYLITSVRSSMSGLLMAFHLPKEGRPMLKNVSRVSGYNLILKPPSNNLSSDNGTILATYAFTTSNNMIYKLNLSDIPGNGVLGITESGVEFTKAALVENTAVALTAPFGAKLKIINNIDDPEKVSVETVDLAPDAFSPFSNKLTAITNYGKYVYIGEVFDSNKNKLVVFDPKTKQVVNEIEVSFSIPRLEVSGDKLIIPLSNKVVVYDLSTPDKPSYYTTVEIYPDSYICAHGNYIYTTNAVYNISNPWKVEKTEVEVSSAGYSPNFGFVKDGYLFVMNNYLELLVYKLDENNIPQPNNITIIDIGDLMKMEKEETTLYGLRGIAHDDLYLYFVSGYNIFAISISEIMRNIDVSFKPIVRCVKFVDLFTVTGPTSLLPMNSNLYFTDGYAGFRGVTINLSNEDVK
jgi:hypothetical protein